MESEGRRYGDDGLAGDSPEPLGGRITSHSPPSDPAPWDMEHYPEAGGGLSGPTRGKSEMVPPCRGCREHFGGTWPSAFARHA